jgi:hypothetical protein
MMRILSRDAIKVLLCQAINRLVTSETSMPERSRGMP